MRRKKERSAPPVGVLIVVAAAAAGGVVVLLRRRGAGEDASGSAGAGGANGGSPAGPEPWTCQCGTEFRVSGADRHRVYWLADAAADDPVLEPDCPTCGTELPRTHDVTI